MKTASEILAQFDPATQVVVLHDPERGDVTDTGLTVGGLARVLALLPGADEKPYQARINDWMQQCFGPAVAADLRERPHRFLEEALELVQATGTTKAEALQLVDYVFGRRAGEPRQEVGGTMVTLAALCTAIGVNMASAAEDELSRVSTPEMVAKLQAKNAAKDPNSPLPGFATAPHSDDEAVDRFAAAMKAKLAAKRAEGRGGWDDKEQCSAEYLSQLLAEHVIKGDPLDVMNFCMMLQQRGERIIAPTYGAEEPSYRLPQDIVNSLLAIGPVEWGQTFSQTDDMHVADFTNTLRLTREHFGITEGETTIHGVYPVGESVVIAHTGTSPNSPQHARIIVGAWNELVERAKAQEAAR